MELALPDGFTPSRVAAADDKTLYLTSERKLIALERKGGGAYGVRWISPVEFKGIVAVAADKQGLAVADVDALVLVDPATGAPLDKFTAAEAPGGRLSPTAIALRTPWLVVADQAGARLLRLRITTQP